jgi:hypothetical protein
VFLSARARTRFGNFTIDAEEKKNAEPCSA